MPGAARITLVVGGLLVASASAAGWFGLFGGRRSIIEILAEAVGILLLLLAWRYRRDRLVVAATIIAATSTLVRTGTITLSPSIGSTTLALALAIDFCILAVTRDRPLWRPTLLAWIVWIVLQFWFAVFGIHLFNADSIDVLGNAAIAPAALIGAAIVAALAFAFRRGAFEASLTWVTIAMTLAFINWPDEYAAPLLFAAAQLSLLAGVFEDSYRLAFHDELTGLPGRRALNEALRNLSGSFSIAMVDVDHFKRFNDRHGHDAGDQVLRMIADELSATGGGGSAYRYGGEEFAIVFPGKSVPELRAVLDDVRSSIAGRRFSLRSPDRPRVKPDKPKKKTGAAKRVAVHVSIGVAGTNSRRTAAHAVLQAADRALYRAKRAGRNRVVAAGDRLGKRG